MFCEKCFKDLQSKLTGQTSGNSEVTGISVVPKGQLVFSNNFILIYIKTKRLVTKGKNKGKKVEDEYYNILNLVIVLNVELLLMMKKKKL